MRPVELIPPQIQRPQGPERMPAVQDAGEAPASAGAPSFGEALRDVLGRVDHGMLNADELAKRYIAGDEVDLHTVVIEMQKADVSFRTMIEVRNKLVDAYREIMNLQV